VCEYVQNKISKCVENKIRHIYECGNVYKSVGISRNLKNPLLQENIEIKKIRPTKNMPLLKHKVSGSQKRKHESV